MAEFKTMLQMGNTAAAMASANPTPAARQLAVETDTGRAKVGDGATAYNSLPYVGDSLAASAGVNPLTGWVHLDAYISPVATAAANAAGLQAAFDAAGQAGTVYLSEAFGNVNIPIAAGVVTVTEMQQSLIGVATRHEYTPRLVGSGSGYIITVKGGNFTCDGINFNGDCDYVGTVFTGTVTGALNIDRSDGSGLATLANLDCRITNCWFGYMHRAVRAIGRNVEFKNNLVSVTWAAFYIERYGSEDCRGFTFINNRFHGVGYNPVTTNSVGMESTCIQFSTFNAFGNQVIGNMCDSGCRVFYKGPLDRTMINDNHMYNQDGSGIVVLDNGGIVHTGWSIVGNTFQGKKYTAWTNTDLAAATTTTDYFIDAPGLVSDGTIAGNQISYTRKHAINLAYAVYVSIAGNSIFAPNMYQALSDGTAYDGINIATGGGYIQIVGNTIRSNGVYRYGINANGLTSGRAVGNAIANAASGNVNHTATGFDNDQERQWFATEVAASLTPPNTLFVDSADHLLKFKNSAGTLKTVTVV